MDMTSSRLAQYRASLHKRKKARTRHRVHHHVTPSTLFGYDLCAHTVGPLCKAVRQQGGEHMTFLYASGQIAVITTVNVCNDLTCPVDHAALGQRLLRQLERDIQARVPMKCLRSAGWRIPGPVEDIFDERDT